MVDNATDRDGGAPRSRGRNGLAAGRLSRGLLWTMLALGAAIVASLVASALEAPDGRAAGAPPRQAAALLGAMLLLVPALFSLAKRGGRASHPPLWFAGHALAGMAGLLLVSWHAAGGRLLSPPGALLALLLFVVLQGTLARLLVPVRLAQQFGSRATAFHLSGGPDRQALAALVARKRALLQALEPGADEALFSPNLKHAVRRPRLTWRYARLAAQEADLVGARRRAGRLLAHWRRLHVAAALVFAAGLLAHLVVVTLFAGYAAAGRPIDWWHLAAWGRESMARLGLSLDLERCTGCKSCEAACKQVNGLGPHEYRNKVMWLGAAEAPALDFLTVTCQQCARPACLRACPVVPKAITKDPDSGVVAVIESRCTGCGECVLACPYGAMGFDPIDCHAVKCDLCAGRRAAGDGPACAAVCPTRAIAFGARDDLLGQAMAAGRTVRDHDHFLQGPATLYLDRRAADVDASAGDRLSLSAPPAILLDHRPRALLGGEDVREPYRSGGTEAPDEIRPGGCHICFNACTLKFHLRDGVPVRILGNDEDPVFEGRICAKSQMTLQLYDNPRRLTTPLKRVGPRGGGRLVPVPWAQALDEIAARLGALRDAHGSEALALHMGTRTGVLNIMGTMRMFAQLWGTPNVLTTEPLCDAGKVVALETTLGSTSLGNVYTEDDIGSAGLYVYFGDNQAETRPVNFGLINHWRLARGARMVVIDPRLTPTAAKADRWLAIRPGTDMALGLALCHEVLAADLYDREFCEDWVAGWREWREFLAAHGYDADWAAPITDLPAATIRALARDMALADGCMLFASRGINQHSNSVQTNRVLMFLAAITGNWGRKGGGYFNVAAEPDWQPVPVPPSRCPQALRPAIGRSPVAWLDAMLMGRPYPIRALICGNNPAAQWPDQGRVHSALAGLDLLVHVELFENQTSALADYVLPAASGIEKGGIGRLAEDRRIVWNERLVNPPGQARSDHWIWIELGKRFGYDDVLKDAYKDPAVFWEQAFRHATPALRGISMARLRASPHRTVRAPLARDTDAESSTLYLPGSTAFGCMPGKRFPTGSGRLEFWTPVLERKYRQMGLSALPEFHAEAEQSAALPYLMPAAGDGGVLSPFFAAPARVGAVAIADPSAASPGARLRAVGFDTVLVTGRPTASHFHSWTHYFWQAQEMWPELYCQIHPVRASRAGVMDGDRVVIETVRGRIEARAWVTAGIRPDVAYVPFGWDRSQPYHPGDPVNRLTAGALDPISHQSNLKTHLCRLSRAGRR